MRKQKTVVGPGAVGGFTLIELLVVISIIALLLSVLVPALSKAKAKAKSVVCRAQLKTFGGIYEMYCMENNGVLPVKPGSTGNIEKDKHSTSGSWVAFLRPYFEDVDDFRLCPSAKKPNLNDEWSIQGYYYGGNKTAWYIDEEQHPYAFGNLPTKDFGIGSYTENYWMRTTRGKEHIWQLYEKDHWQSYANVSHPNRVPLMMDGRWANISPLSPEKEGGRPPICLEDVSQAGNGNGWWAHIKYALCIRRHGKGINICFADGSVTGVDCEDLYSLKWSPTYRTIGRVEMPFLPYDDVVRRR